MSEISLYFDYFNGDSPIPNGKTSTHLWPFKKTMDVGFNYNSHEDAVWQTSHIINDLKLFDISIDIKSISDFKPNNNTNRHWYVLEPYLIIHCFEGRNNILNCISPEALRLLQKGLLELIIWYPKEAHDLDYKDWFKYLNFQIKKLKIKKSLLFFSDLNIKENLQNWLQKNRSKVKIKVQGLDYWIDSHSTLMNHYYRAKEAETFLEPSISLKNKKREKHFLCLNGVAKFHRVLLVNELHKRKLTEKCYHSLLFRYGSTIDPEQYIYLSDYYDDMDEIEKMSKVKSLGDFLDRHTPEQPIILDNKISSFGENDRVHKTWTFENSYCSLVSESVVENNIFFLTEKTYKCFHFLHPFLIYGSAGTLAHLKEMGFETFPEWFDENYDDEPHVGRRFEMILKNIENLCKKDLEEVHDMYLNSWDKLVHNWNLFFSENRKSQCKEAVLETQHCF